MGHTTALSASAPTAMIGGEIPLIDISVYLAGEPGAAERAAAAAALRLRECRLLLSGRSRRAASLIETAYEEAARFHALPIEQKLAVKVDEHNIGYVRLPEPPPNAARRARSPARTRPTSCAASAAPTIPTCSPTAASTP